MWLSSKWLDLFSISRSVVEDQREELAKVRAERDTLLMQVALSSTNVDWMRIRVNQLEQERAQLIYKLYGIDVPSPEITKKPISVDFLGSDLFEDMGDTRARELGLPTYDKN